MDRTNNYTIVGGTIILVGLLAWYCAHRHHKGATIEQLQGIYHIEPGVYGNDTLGSTITLWPNGRCLVENLPIGLSSQTEIIDKPDIYDVLTFKQLCLHSDSWGAPIRYNFSGYWRPLPLTKYSYPTIELTNGDSTFLRKNDNDFIIKIYYQYNENIIMSKVYCLWGNTPKEVYYFSLPKVASFD